jgi:exodeoxyribonuclease VII small subunit
MNKKKSFEESVQRLEEIVSDLENSEIKLDDMLHLYQEGSELIKVCLLKLDDVEKKISVLSVGSSDKIEERPLEEE